MERPTLTTDSLKQATEILEQALENRQFLGELTTEDRQRLLIAAGRLSRPDRLQMMKLAKQHRRKKKQLSSLRDRTTRAKTEIRKAREMATFLPPVQSDSRALGQSLENARPCYVCKSPFTSLHFFYDTMCPTCATENYAKRHLNVDLKGRIALVTGARVKIGYHIGLKLLQAGARVVVTTRFPRDAARRYAMEPDFETFKDRLHVYGLDLRHAPSVEIFTRHLLQTLPHLDILINNAAQTVRRPVGFYKDLLGWETQDWTQVPDSLKPLLEPLENCKRALVSTARTALAEGTMLLPINDHSPAPGLTRSAELALTRWTDDDFTANETVFPKGQLDVDLQQVDMRTMNTWRMTLAEVPTAEMIEVQLINSISPFILCSQLKPLFLKSSFDRKFIVNVSAMEGKFTRYTKTDKHPHTNMAKAALNMLTLTSAMDYAKAGIYMNAVDTGWVTDEDPWIHAERKKKEQDFQPPLDIVDGAARVLDPIYMGVLDEAEPVWGKFLKDYKPTSW